jgi:hypothetical protein
VALDQLCTFAAGDGAVSQERAILAWLLLVCSKHEALKIAEVVLKTPAISVPALALPVTGQRSATLGQPFRMLGDARCLRYQLRVRCQISVSLDVDVPHRHAVNAQPLSLQFGLDGVDRSLPRQHPYARSTEM